jgi:ribosomal protein S18 acetylase RimI-like enzyme
MDQQITIRKVNLNEASTLLQLGRQTFFEAFAAINHPEDMEAYAAANFTFQKTISELTTIGSTFYFAVADNHIVGYLKLNTGSAQTESQQNETLEVERIYILSKYQGKKFGEQLLNYAISIAKQANYKHIWLGVWENNHNAIRFYNRHGFNTFGSHYFMLGNDKQVDILMRKELF